MNGFLKDTGAHLTMEHSFHLSVMPFTHAHAQYELYFCSQKVAQRSVINGVEYTYKYPCAILSAPFTVHSMSCEDKEAKQYERYVFYFGEELLRSFDRHLLPAGLFGQSVGLLFALTEGQAAHLKRMIDLCDSDSSLAQRELMFLLFLNKLLEFCPMENVVRVGTSSFYISDVLRYISERYQSGADADRVAKHFAVSRSKLDRDFKRFTGVTVHDFADTCRLNKAKYLLEFQRAMPIGEVAEQSGFESETYFFPFFKKNMGMTPSEFRKMTQTRVRRGDTEIDRGCGD